MANEPIKIELIGADKIDRWAGVFKRARADVLNKMYESAQRFGEESETSAKNDYLRGPRPSKLGRIHGRLASKITHKTDRSGNIIAVTLGTNVEYGRIHEYGFDDDVRVHAHTRIVNKVFGRPTASAVSQRVKAFSRHMKMPKRPFLTPAVKDNMPTLKGNLAGIIDDIGNNLGAV